MLIGQGGADLGAGEFQTSILLTLLTGLARTSAVHAPATGDAEVRRAATVLAAWRLIAP